MICWIINLSNNRLYNPCFIFHIIFFSGSEGNVVPLTLPGCSLTDQQQVTLVFVQIAGNAGRIMRWVSTEAMHTQDDPFRIVALQVTAMQFQMIL